MLGTRIHSWDPPCGTGKWFIIFSEITKMSFFKSPYKGNSVYVQKKMVFQKTCFIVILLIPGFWLIEYSKRILSIMK